MRNEKNAWWIVWETSEGNTLRHIKTTKKPTILRNWRRWLSSRSSNRMEVLSFDVTVEPAVSNIFFVTVETARRLEVEQKSGLDNSVFLKMLFQKVNSLASDGCGQIHLPHATFSLVQSLHRSHSTDDMCEWLKIEFRPQIGQSSTRHVSPWATKYTEHQTCCPRIPFSTVESHGGMLFPRNSIMFADHQSKRPWQGGGKGLVVLVGRELEKGSIWLTSSRRLRNAHDAGLLCPLIFTSVIALLRNLRVVTMNRQEDWQFPGICENLWRCDVESLFFYVSPIWNKMVLQNGQHAEWKKVRQR